MTTLASTLLIIFAAIGAVSLGVWVTFFIQYMNGPPQTPAEIELAFIKTCNTDLVKQNQNLTDLLQSARHELDTLNNTIIAKLLAK